METFSQAAEFIWKNARLLERRLFAFHFAGGSRAAVLSALSAFQNADGGFGNALEPDIRCPDSQPVPVQHALEILDAVGFEELAAQRACDFLLTITTHEGGVPFVLPSVRNYPHAPWWQTQDHPPAALNPTASIAGLLHKNRFSHPWLDEASNYCWAHLRQSPLQDDYELAAIIRFLEHVPDRARAEKEFVRIGKRLQEGDFSKAVLRWADTPGSYCRRFFSDSAVGAALDDLVAGQREDGGWSIDWPPISPGCEVEWRGWVTVAALLTLRANSRL